MIEAPEKLGENLAQMLGVAPFQPPAQFDPVETVQSEFVQGSDEQFVQDWLAEHNSRWRLARINADAHYMMVYEQANPTLLEMWGY